eukprot:1706201-Pyramimonas_sp.AAC.1
MGRANDDDDDDPQDFADWKAAGWLRSGDGAPREELGGHDGAGDGSEAPETPQKTPQPQDIMTASADKIQNFVTQLASAANESNQKSIAAAVRAIYTNDHASSLREQRAAPPADEETL